jgi:hypothetical protein
MNLMLNCFKTKDYDQQLCAKEIADFNKCYNDYKASLFAV